MPDFNARITRADIGFEDHGIFTAVITLDFGGTRQGFGNYDLRAGQSALKFISGVLTTLGVIEWSKLPGTVLRVRKDSETSHAILAIGHAIEDRWFDPQSIYDAGDLPAHAKGRQQQLFEIEKAASVGYDSGYSAAQRGVGDQASAYRLETIKSIVGGFR